MIDIAKDVAKEESANIIYQVEDATNLSFYEESFDGVLLPNNGLASIPGHENRKQVLDEICRVLKPHGYVILCIPLRYYARHYLLHWIKTWVGHFILKPLKYNPTEINFGDYFYHRHNKGEILDQVQFLHFFSNKEIEKLIIQSGLKIIEKKLMSDISKKDGISKEGSLSEKDDTSKSPIFYVCQKLRT